MTISKDKAERRFIYNAFYWFILFKVFFQELFVAFKPKGFSFNQLEMLAQSSYRFRFLIESEILLL